MSTYGFGTPAPEKVEAPKLPTSGLAGYEHEVKLKDGQTVKVIALHNVDQSFQINVHKRQVNYDGLGFRSIPVGTRNTHLPFLATPVKSPFESDPDPKVRSWKTARFALVFILESPNEKQRGHVGFLELRDNYLRQDGSYNLVKEYEEQSGEGVEGHVITYSRTGSSIKDTSYKTTILKSQNLTKEQQKVVDAEVPEVRDYILGLYDKEWTTEEFQRIYEIFVAQNRVETAPVQTEPVRPSHPHAAVSEADEIPF